MEDFQIFSTSGTDIDETIPFYFSHEFHNKYFKEYSIEDGIHIQTCLAIPLRDKNFIMLCDSLKEFKVIEWTRGKMRDDRITFGCKIRSVNPEIIYHTCINKDIDSKCNIKHKIIFISKRKWND